MRMRLCCTRLYTCDMCTMLIQVPSKGDSANEDGGSVVTTVTVRILVSYTGSAKLENITLVRFAFNFLLALEYACFAWSSLT